MGGELTLAPQAREEATVVFASVQLDDVRSRELGGCEDHELRPRSQAAVSVQNGWGSAESQTSIRSAGRQK